MGLTRIRAQQISDIDYKQSVRVITVTNVVLSGETPAQVDGVSLTAGNRVLVIGQSTASENGIYQVSTAGAGSTGTWIRSNDANQTGEIEAGMIVMVTEGEIYGDTQWKLITNDPIAVGETPLTFVKNGAFEFGNIYANGTPVVASTVGDTVAFTAGTNITITANAESKTVTFASAGGSPGGNTTEVQFNNAGVFSGSANFSFDGANVRVGGDVVPAANLSHDLGNATNYWRSLYVGGNTIYLGGLQLQDTGTNTLAIFSADGQTPANITATSSNAVFATSAGVVTTNAQPNITSLGTLTALAVTGNVAGGNLTTVGAVTGNGRALTSLNATNIDTGTLAAARLSGTYTITVSGAATTAGTVTTAAQPNITSVGTLTALAVTGNVTSGNVSGTTGAFTTVTGAGSGLTSLDATNIASGTLAQARLANAAVTLGSTALTLGATVTTVAGLSSVTSTTFVGALTGAATTAGTVTTAAQANITSVGTLTSLAVTGNVTSGNVSGTTVTGTTVKGGNISVAGDLITSVHNTITIDPAAAGVTGLVVIAGNLQVTGTTTTIDSTVVTVNDLAINVANNASTSSAANDGGLRVGPVGSEYATWLYNQSGNVWSTGLGITATGNVTGGNVSGTTGAFTTVTGNGSGLTSLSATNISSGTLAQARLANAAVTLGSTALTLGATVTTVAGLSSVTSTTFVGALTGAATTAGTVTSAAQANITSVGTLTSLAVTGNVDSGNVTATGNITASFFKGDGSLLTGISSSGGITWTTSAAAPSSPNPGDFWYDTDDDKKYQYTNDGTGNAWVDQSAPTSFGNLTVGNILNGGANGTGNVGSSTGYFNTVFSTNGTFINVTGNGRALTSLDASNIDTGTLPSGRLSGTYTITVSGAATTAGTVTTAAQPNITSVGTLTALTMGGLLTGVNSAATDVNIANDSGSFSARGNTTTVASMTFHRTNAFAINMGLGVDNIFRIGGFSASNNCMQLSGTGAMTILGSMTVNSAGGATAIVNAAGNGVGNIGSSTAVFNTVFAKATSAQYADLAENYQADSGYEPGTVVVFGGSAEVTISNISHDTRVAGVVSTNPSYLMNSGLTGNTVAAVALTGRVPCWVQGPVSKGDRIVNVRGGIGGRMKSAEYEPGCIVGKSLEDIVDDSVQLIEVVIGRF